MNQKCPICMSHRNTYFHMMQKFATPGIESDAIKDLLQLQIRGEQSLHGLGNNEENCIK